MSEKYKWDCPSDWLKEKIDKAEGDGNLEKLAWYARALASSHDHDEIQDLFQSEMDADGYFELLA